MATHTKQFCVSAHRIIHSASIRMESMSRQHRKAGRVFQGEVSAGGLIALLSQEKRRINVGEVPLNDGRSR